MNKYLSNCFEPSSREQNPLSQPTVVQTVKRDIIQPFLIEIETSPF